MSFPILIITGMHIGNICVVRSIKKTRIQSRAGVLLLPASLRRGFGFPHLIDFIFELGDKIVPLLNFDVQISNIFIPFPELGLKISG